MTRIPTSRSSAEPTDASWCAHPAARCAMRSARRSARVQSASCSLTIGRAGKSQIAVSGAISSPHAHRASRSGLILIVNRRRVHNRALLAAIDESYRGLIPGGRHGYGVVCVDVAPETLDVNVHPAKREVRFSDERAVFSAVQHVRSLGGSLAPCCRRSAPAVRYRSAFASRVHTGHRRFRLWGCKCWNCARATGLWRWSAVRSTGSLRLPGAADDPVSAARQWLLNLAEAGAGALGEVVLSAMTALGQRRERIPRGDGGRQRSCSSIRMPRTRRSSTRSSANDGADGLRARPIRRCCSCRSWWSAAPVRSRALRTNMKLFLAMRLQRSSRSAPTTVRCTAVPASRRRGADPERLVSELIERLDEPDAGSGRAPAPAPRRWSHATRRCGSATGSTSPRSSASSTAS